MTPMTETILLTIPSGTRYQGVATLVLGGIGSRLDLPYERVDDLQMAVLSILEAGKGGDVTLHVDADGAVVTVSVGPLRDGSGADDGLARVLDRLVDDVASEQRDGEEWLRLRLATKA
jgi:hypothetical protein